MVKDISFIWQPKPLKIDIEINFFYEFKTWICCWKNYIFLDVYIRPVSVKGLKLTFL